MEREEKKKYVRNVLPFSLHAPLETEPQITARGSDEEIVKELMFLMFPKVSPRLA